MIPATTPITHERALADLRAMLYVAQHARSVMAEKGWNDDIAQLVLADISPWLWDKTQCIVLPLAKLIQRCEQNGGKVPYIDYYNFLIIAQRTPAIGAGCILTQKRELPEPDVARIIASELGQEI